MFSVGGRVSSQQRFHLLGVEKATGRLVVLAEATTLTGQTTHLPHHCTAIPADVHATHAPDTVLVRPANPPA